MSLTKEIVKGVSWALTGVTVLASVEALLFPDLKDHFLTIAALGMMLFSAGFAGTQVID